MEPTPAQLEQVFRQAVDDYLAARRARIDDFCRRHFSPAGAWRLNRRALGKDLLRTPANVLWAGPYLLTRGAGALLGRLGWRELAQRIERLPPGLRTDVERELEWRIHCELLELPCRQEEREYASDALFAALLARPEVGNWLRPELLELHHRAREPAFRERLAAHLATYTASRTAAAELSAVLLNLAAGVAAFKSLTPGTLAMGGAMANAVAQQLAVANFALGSSLGGLYYSAFPASASLGLLTATTGGLLVALGVVSALAGVVTDPLQQALGLHRRKLHKLLDALEGELKGEQRGLAIRDAYVARLFDLLDLLQAARLGK
ncbi:MAG TPA: DUF6635 family protein [Candidatus Competibacteraceae bacterium]|nr:DUF6635 family protein [Candidatus Competibacteraceae bacterium]